MIRDFLISFSSVMVGGIILYRLIKGWPAYVKQTICTKFNVGDEIIHNDSTYLKIVGHNYESDVPKYLVEFRNKATHLYSMEYIDDNCAIDLEAKHLREFNDDLNKLLSE